MKKNTVIAIMLTFCFTASIFMIIPIQSANSPYNPWIDSNDDGKIGLQDLVLLANSYGTNGTPLTKASIQYDSGWINITDKCGQNMVITHKLNSTDLIVDVQGKTTPDGGPMQRNYGLNGYMQGWSKTYGGTDYDEAYALVQTSDGGYALAGYTDSFGAGNYDAWLVKTDASGNTLWNRTYGGTSDEGAYALVQTTDGGYALAGITTSLGSVDYWLVKTDASGNMEWNQTYGGTGIDWALALVQTSDGGYALTGWTGSFGAGSHDSWLVKTDVSGNMQWNNTYGGTGIDMAAALVQTSDGGYALTGSTTSLGAGYFDFWLVKTDASGNMQWNNTYGGTGIDQASALLQTTDLGYALAGSTTSFGTGGTDFWLIKTDTSGNMQWNQTYGGTGEDFAGHALVQTSDGGYALAGMTSSFGAGNADAWLVKADASGNLQWCQTYGGTNEDYARALVRTTEGKYALAGYTTSFGAGGEDSWLVKTDASGNLGVESGLAWVDSSANTVTLYRGATDIYWNYVRVRLWEPKTP